MSVARKSRLSTYMWTTSNPFCFSMALNGDLPPGEVPLPGSPGAPAGGSSALDEAMAKTLAAIDPSLVSSIPIPEDSK